MLSYTRVYMLTMQQTIVYSMLTMYLYTACIYRKMIRPCHGVHFRSAIHATLSVNPVNFHSPLLSTTPTCQPYHLSTHLLLLRVYFTQLIQPTLLTCISLHPAIINTPASQTIIARLFFVIPCKTFQCSFPDCFLVAELHCLISSH